MEPVTELFEDGRRRKRRAKPLTEARLRRWAEQHLQRYPATEKQLLRVLRRRMRRSLDECGGDEEQAERWLHSLVQLLRQAGLLDDRRVAVLWTEDLHRRGTPQRAIRAKLRQKGVSSELVDEALARLKKQPDSELMAAVAYARRRRLGPFRAEEAQRKERREKDLAAIMRRGFPPDIAFRVVDGAREDFESFASVP